MKNGLELDGAQGEGGGQILRTALSLSMITGTPFRIERIRAGRAKPGLLRQHLTAVNAAAEVCGAHVVGAAPGSSQLEFTPGPIQAGAYRYAIGSAGSATLVLQTVLPALWYAPAPSSVQVSGGTHNSAAPPADFLKHAWLPLMAQMGLQMTLSLERHGFYPAGGGILSAQVQPLGVPLCPLNLTTRGPVSEVRACAIVAGIPREVAQRELHTLSTLLEPHLGPILQEIRQLPAHEGPGNALLLSLHTPELCEVFTAFGEKGLAAERVAEQLAEEARRYAASPAPIGEHLADQLLLPLALTGQGRFSCTTASPHVQTNAAVIEKFLPVEISIEAAAEAYHIRIDGEHFQR